MKNIIMLISLIAFLMGGCTKQVLKASIDNRQTVVFTTWQFGEDYMPHGYALYCFKGDIVNKTDSVLYFNTNDPDTNYLHLSTVTEEPTTTRRVDSSAVIAGVLFNFYGEILHRKYNNVDHIDSIHFANGKTYIRKSKMNA